MGQPASQATDRQVDRAIDTLVRIAARELHQPLAVKHPPGALGQGLQQREFAPAQDHLGAIGREQAALPRQQPPPGKTQFGNSLPPQLLLPAQQRADARDQFARVERLWQGVVGAPLPAGCPVGCGSCGQYRAGLYPDGINADIPAIRR